MTQTISLATRGWVAKLYIEVDLNQPHIEQFMLEGKYYKVGYKGLHSICFTYGIHGHTMDGYPINMAQGMKGLITIDMREVNERTVQRIRGRRKLLNIAYGDCLRKK